MNRLFKLAALTLTVGVLHGTGLIAPQSGAAFAQDTESSVIFTRKHWEVRVVEFGDGTLACVAEVDHRGGSFLIWVAPGSDARLQFYSDDWQFDNETADIQLQIDRRGVWDLTNAELDQNSVFFTMNDDDTSVRFLREVMRGNILKLSSSSGREITRYSLAGSSASILALVDCNDALADLDGDDNPFN